MKPFPSGAVRALASAALAASAAAPLVSAAQGVADAGPPRNVYAAGGEVRPRLPVAGDLMAAGGRVVVEQAVAGDAALAGGAVEVRAPVGDDLRAVGGSVAIGDRVGGDVVAAGGDVALRRGAVVGGTADLTAANVEVEGQVEGSLRARGARIFVDGDLRGPVQLAGERIELGPRARIRGPLTYESPAELRRADGAVLEGSLTRSTGEGNGAGRAGGPAAGHPLDGPGVVVLYLALFAFASGFVLLLPDFADRAASRLRGSPWASLGIGAASVVAVPLAAGLLVITVLGMPLALALLAAYPVLLLGGFVVGVLCLSRLLPVLRRGAAEQPGRPAPIRLAPVALALAVIVLLGLVPAVGGLFIVLLGLAGLGAGLLQWRGRGAAAGKGQAGMPLPGRDVFPA